MTGTAVLVIKTMAACTGMIMILSPSILIYRVFKQKDVGVASVIPLVTLFCNCHAWAVWGYMIENWFPIFWIYVVGDFIALAFLSVYWKYTKQRRYVNRVLLIMATIQAVVTIYAIVGGFGYTNQSRDSMSTVLGLVADVTAVCMYAAPMEKLLQVLKYKSAAFINAHMVVAGLTNNCLWFTYGVLTDNWFIISPNIIFISLNTFSLVLCVVFDPKTHPLPEDFYVQGDNEGELVSSCKADSTLPSPAFEAMHSPLESIQCGIMCKHGKSQADDGAVWLLLICSPAIATFRIFRRKDVGVASIVPLATLLANSHLWMLYGYSLRNWFPVFSVFLFGDAAGLVYLSVYWRYTPERRQAARVLGVTLAVLIVATVYALLAVSGYTGQTRAQAVSTVGILCDIVAVCLYGAPM